MSKYHPQKYSELLANSINRFRVFMPEGLGSDGHAQYLTLNPLTWKIWWVPNNDSRWQMGFNSAFKGL